MKRYFSIFRPVFIFVAVLLSIISTGTVGYMLIEGWNFFDSFYMTIITMSTVGFGEVHQLSDAGRLFTTFLLISCFGIFAYAISSFTNFIVDGEYKKRLRELKLLQKVNAMKNHTIVCGFGRVGKQVSDDLLMYNKPFVIIERNIELIRKYESNKRLLFIHGDPTEDGVLEEAKTGHASILITCLPKDSDNMFVALSAREMNAQLTIISRASHHSAVEKLKLAGSNHVVIPDAIGGSHMAALVNNPDVIEFMDAIKVQGESGVNIESISFDEIPAAYRNKPIGELELKKNSGATIIGFRTPGGDYIINPDDDMKLVEKSQLFVLGSSDQINRLNKLFELNQ